VLVKLSPYTYLGGQCSVDGHLSAISSNLSFCSAGERATELNVSIDAIEQSLLCVAVAAIPRILSRVAERDGDSLERPTLSASVHGQRHRSAGAKCRKQKVVRPRPGISPPTLPGSSATSW
jgi:hypothetical protein